MEKVFIIAEAGVNHNGSFEIAKEMVDVASAAGVDCIKFQTIKSDKIVSKYAPKADYQKLNTGKDQSQLDMLKQLELSNEEFCKLNQYCKSKNIIFASTPFDIGSIDFLNKMEMRFLKIPSGEITNLPYLEKIASCHKPVIMSTGMSYLKEVEDAVNVLKGGGCRDITLLHCTTEYPTPYKDVNLRAIVSMREYFNLPVGFSDHTLGIEVALGAVALGAAVIEKHFTLDRNMSGPDHKASLEPDELTDLVMCIRNVEQAVGTGEKKPVTGEDGNKSIARKSIVAGRYINRGEVFSETNLTIKRPGSGISPMQWYQILGRTAVRDFEEDELIEL